jgi:hypothetical protein
MTIEQHMFINYKSTSITVSVTTYENTGEFEMTTSGQSYETLIATHYLNGEESVTWNLVVPAGGIRGFGVNNGSSYSNPDSQYLTILTTSGKDPWPSPPATAPALFTAVSDYATRYANFLMALSGTREQRRPPSAVAPAPAAPSGES